MSEVVRLNLPYPPTVNLYYRHVGPRVLISAQGRDYRERVQKEVAYHSLLTHRPPGALQGRLWVRVVARPPDRRKRDLDNVLKALLDALKHAGVYEDDCQIDRLEVERGEVVKGGRAEVSVGVLAGPE